jgi:Sulfotransferase family
LPASVVGAASASPSPAAGPFEVPRVLSKVGMDVVFTGGTGLSGTTIVGQLIGAHPAFVTIPIETRFISLAGGLCDLANERVTVEQFEERFLTEWYPSVGRRGIDHDVDRSIVDAALARLRDRHRGLPFTAAREFAHAVLDPIAEAAGVHGWVEMTPGNGHRARSLERMFPSMRLVHTYRDGRDVASSVVSLDWGPNDLAAGLDWWADGIGRAFGAVAWVDGRAMNLQLEDLLAWNRDAEYRRLVDFLGVSDAPEMRAFFDERMTEADAHIGRWRAEVSLDDLAEFEAHHERLAAALVAEGYPYVPVMEAGGVPAAGRTTR